MSRTKSEARVLGFEQPIEATSPKNDMDGGAASKGSQKEA